MNSKVTDQKNKVKLTMLLRRMWDYKLNPDVSLVGLS
jgi:hypothetical protein